MAQISGNARCFLFSKVPNTSVPWEKTNDTAFISSRCSTQTSSPSASLSLRFAIPSTAPLLSSLVTHMLLLQRCPDASNLQHWSPPAKKGDPREIRLANHCLKPLWAHRPRDKDSQELYSALAGLGGCLFWDWQARLFLRWEIAAGQPTASHLPSYYLKSSSTIWNKLKGMSPLSWERDARCIAG